MARPSKYPRELRERAVRAVAQAMAQGEYPSEFEAIRTIARKLGIGSPETLRKWIRQAEVDGGTRPGKTTQELAEIRELKKEVAELVRRTGFPVYSAPMGKTSFDEQYERYGGVSIEDVSSRSSLIVPDHADLRRVAQPPRNQGEGRERKAHHLDRWPEERLQHRKLHLPHPDDPHHRSEPPRPRTC